MFDFVYLALTLLSFAGFALLVGLLGSRLPPVPAPDGERDPLAAPRPEPGPMRTPAARR